MRGKTPQEKKQLSYDRDRRNTYGESDKASRKAIPFRKRSVNKANRHADAQALAQATGAADEGLAAATDDKLHGRRRKRWRKQPNEPLGAVLARRNERPRGWRPVGTVLEGQTIIVGGVDPWASPWKRGAGHIAVPHPSYPDQRHDLAIWSIWSVDHPVTFAAGELSNGVWSFYEPA